MKHNEVIPWYTDTYTHRQHTMFI